MIDAATLREKLHYDPETGIFTWRVAAARRRKPGEVAGRQHPVGYIGIGIDNRDYYAHRLAFIYMNGHPPIGEVDHIDGDKTNNAWSNLRQVDATTNQENRVKAQANNLSGFLGVSKHPSSNKFFARIKINRKSIFLGNYDTPEDAHAAYLEAKRKLHRGCTI